MSSALFRSFGAFGATGKLVLISVVTLLFSFFLIIPSKLFPQNISYKFPCI